MMRKRRKKPQTKSGKAGGRPSAARPGANARRRRRKPTGTPEDASKTPKARNENGTRSKAGGENGDGQAAASAPDELKDMLEEQANPVAEEDITARVKPLDELEEETTDPTEGAAKTEAELIDAVLRAGIRAGFCQPGESNDMHWFDLDLIRIVHQTLSVPPPSIRTREKALSMPRSCRSW